MTVEREQMEFDVVVVGACLQQGQRPGRLCPGAGCSRAATKADAAAPQEGTLCDENGELGPEEFEVVMREQVAASLAEPRGDRRRAGGWGARRRRGASGGFHDEEPRMSAQERGTANGFCE